MKQHIVMLGTSPGTMGGIASVVNVYRDAGLMDRWAIRYITTHCDGSAREKLLLAAQAWVRLAGLLMMGRVGLLHVHVSSRASFWRKFCLTLPSVLAGRPLVLHLHGSEFHLFHDSETPAALRPLIRWFFERADRVIVLSDAWRAWVESRFPAARAVVVHNPAVLPPSCNGAERHPASVLFLGRLGQRKGSYDLLAATARLATEFPDLRLLLGGDGELEQVRQKAQDLGIADHVELLGWVTGARKRDLLAQAAVYVLPSYNEGLPMSVLEAMAAGLPVVSTRVGGIPEAVREGEDGFLIEPGDIDALTDRLRTLLADAGLRRRMGDAARQRVAEQFSAEVIVPRVEAIYDELLTARPSGLSRRGRPD